VENEKFSGTAAPVLQAAISEAQFVLIGEDHLTREIPQFAAAVCDVMAPHGLSAMALEVGPRAAEFLSASLNKPDRLARMAALTRRYPYSVAFLNMQQENDLAAHCAQVAHRSHVQLWGLDQEFVGSAGWLLDQILATHPGPAATAAIKTLKSEEERDAADAKQTGDSTKIFLMAVPNAELKAAAAALKRDGSPRANTIFRELMDSHKIYLENLQGSPESNSDRARLLKQNFRRNLGKATAGGEKQRVLVKFGDWHLYKGFNPLRQRDLGNYIAEMADGQETHSLHICILGAKGMHRLMTGYEKPDQLVNFVMDEDSDYRWLKPAIENQLADAWTMYDLRKLRFQKLGPIDEDVERMIYGYDLLVIIPELTPADPVQ
jgi:hypothetical protein